MSEHFYHGATSNSLLIIDLKNKRNLKPKNWVFSHPIVIFSCQGRSVDPLRSNQDSTYHSVCYSLQDNIKLKVKTGMKCKKGYGPISLLDMHVLAALMIDSRPSSSTLKVRLSWMYFTASLPIKRKEGRSVYWNHLVHTHQTHVKTF